MDQIGTHLIEAAAPYVVDFVVSIVAVIIAGIDARATKTQLDKNAREALHSALRTGATVVLDREMTQSQKIEAMLEYAESSVPDALKRLKPKVSVLQALALSKIEETLSGAGR